MESHFQRHSGAHKPTSDSTPTYQVWLPPAIESHDDRTRHRTIRQDLDCTADVPRAAENYSSSRAYYASVPHVVPSGNNYTTHPSNGRGSHVPTKTQAKTAFASAATPFYPGPGQHLGGSSGWSTIQRPPAPMHSPSFERAPTVHREDDAQHQRRCNDRYRDADKGRERERWTREREVDVARYQVRAVEKSGRRKDYVQHRDIDENRRAVFDDERERRDRRRNKEKIKRDKEKESESDRNRDLERGRIERTGVQGQDKEYREAHNVRERGKDRNVTRGQHTERDAGRDMARDSRREREYNEPREREKRKIDRRVEGKVQEKDEDCGIQEREHGLNGKGPATAGKYGFGGISEVHKDLREEHPYVTYQPRDSKDESQQSRQYDQVRGLDQGERRRDNRKDKSYLDKRFEPGNAEWDSASMLSPRPWKQQQHTPAHDETNSDNSPRKGSPRLSKYKHNLAEVEAPHLRIMVSSFFYRLISVRFFFSLQERRGSVPSAPQGPVSTHPRQVTSPSSSRDNQARYANLNYSSLPYGHREKDMTLVSPRQLSRVDPRAVASSLGEIGRPKHEEHVSYIIECLFKLQLPNYSRRSKTMQTTLFWNFRLHRLLGKS